VSGEGKSITALGVYASADTWVTCHHYPEQTPILVIDAGTTSLSISVKGRDASESAVEFARALARHAQEFAADVERLHPGRTAPGTFGTAEQAP
jgi:hypothetical protein